MMRQRPPLGRAILATGAVIGTACASVLFAAPADAAVNSPVSAAAPTTCGSSVISTAFASMQQE